MYTTKFWRVFLHIQQPKKDNPTKTPSFDDTWFYRDLFFVPYHNPVVYLGSLSSPRSTGTFESMIFPTSPFGGSFQKEGVSSSHPTNQGTYTWIMALELRSHTHARQARHAGGMKRQSATDFAIILLG